MPRISATVEASLSMFMTKYRRRLGMSELVGVPTISASYAEPSGRSTAAN